MAESKRKLSSAFDIRTIIGALLGIYGVILTLMGLFNATDAELDKTDGFNVNLVIGLSLVGVSVLFFVWVWLRPLVVDAAQIPDDRDHAGPERPEGSLTDES